MNTIHKNLYIIIYIEYKKFKYYYIYYIQIEIIYKNTYQLYD